jgi:hypothetical protein
MSDLRSRAASSRLKVFLKKSPKREKKWRVTFENGKHVDFGQKGYLDFTLDKYQGVSRQKRYVKRHARMHENWTKSGIHTAGFWSRWLLWSKPTMTGAKALIKKKFGITLSDHR